MICYGLTINPDPESETTINRPKGLKPINTFLLGVSVTFLEAPTALPYIVAIERLTQSKLNLLQFISILVFYNIIFILPLLALLLIYITYQKRASVIILRGCLKSVFCSNV